MERKQIYIAKEQEDQLKELAERRGVSESHLIREALTIYIAGQERIEVGRPEDHPLWGLIGLVDGADVPEDGALNHDHYLYGAAKKK
jgi:Ribbon-helix-helix protein, copG family